MKPFNIVVTGSRKWPGVHIPSIDSLLEWVVGRQEEARRRPRIWHGDAQDGVDAVVRAWCEDHPTRVDQFRIPVHPEVDGPWPGAGPARNRRLVGLSQAHLGLAFRYRMSCRGTDSCIEALRAKDVPVLIYEL